MCVVIPCCPEGDDPKPCDPSGPRVDVCVPQATSVCNADNFDCAGKYKFCEKIVESYVKAYKYIAMPDCDIKISLHYAARALCYARSA